MMAVESAPLSWRISPGQIALLILVVSPCAAINIYWHPSAAVRVVTIVIGVVALVMAIASFRMYLYIDNEGVAVRYLRREQWLPWADIVRMEVVSGVRGSDTIRIHRKDGGHVDVPPSLLQPSRPTAKYVARRRLHDTLAQIEARRPGRR
jgi:hypothetical protein